MATFEMSSRGCPKSHLTVLRNENDCHSERSRASRRALSEVEGGSRGIDICSIGVAFSNRFLNFTSGTRDDSTMSSGSVSFGMTRFFKLYRYRRTVMNLFQAVSG